MPYNRPVYNGSGFLLMDLEEDKLSIKDTTAEFALLSVEKICCKSQQLTCTKISFPLFPL